MSTSTERQGCLSSLSDAGLQVPVQQRALRLRRVVHHARLVLSAVAALGLVQPPHLLQAEHVLETLLEVLREERVEDGVGAAVGVSQHHHEGKSAPQDGRGADGARYRGDVEDVERQPAEDEHRHHDGHHAGHLPLGALPLGGAHADPRRLHLDDDEEVAEADDHERQEEAQDEGVEHEGGVVGLLGLGPHDGAEAAVVLGDDAAVDDDGNVNDQRHPPHCQVDGLGHARLAPLGGLNGMHHRQVAVDAHHHQAEDGRELVQGVQGHHHPAEHGAEGPVDERQLDGDERQAQHEEHVGHRQVQDVDVGDRLHLGVAQDDVDDEGVPAEPHGANHEVHAGDDHRADLVEAGVRVVPVELGLVPLQEAVVHEVVRQVGGGWRKDQGVHGSSVSVPLTPVMASHLQTPRPAVSNRVKHSKMTPMVWYNPESDVTNNSFPHGKHFLCGLNRFSHLDPLSWEQAWLIARVKRKTDRRQWFLPEAEPSPPMCWFSLTLLPREITRPPPPPCPSHAAKRSAVNGCTEFLADTFFFLFFTLY